MAFRWPLRVVMVEEEMYYEITFDAMQTDGSFLAAHISFSTQTTEPSTKRSTCFWRSKKKPIDSKEAALGKREVKTKDGM